MAKSNTRKRFALLLAVLSSVCPLQAAEAIREHHYKVLNGAKYQVCQDYKSELEKHKVTADNYCGVAIPLDNPDYKLPVWETLDPAAHMDIVKEIYYWHNLGSNMGKELYTQQVENPSKIIPELMDMLWPKAEAQIIALISAGKVELQHSRFDIDHDGTTENVYRMTPLIRNRGAIPPTEQSVHEVIIGSPCENFDLPGANKRYLTYVPVAELKESKFPWMYDTFRLNLNEFFYWRGRIYEGISGGVFEPNRTSGTLSTQVCGVTF